MESFLEYWRKRHEGYRPITLHETCNDDGEPRCSACGVLMIGGPTYKIDGYVSFYLHKSCAELPGKIQHPLHPQHPLTVGYCGSFICDGCRHVSFGYLYCCEECKFKLDVQCVSKNEGQALKERVEKHTVYHPHKLQLVDFHSPVPTCLSESFVCCCCLQSCPGGRGPTYACNFCLKSVHPFVIHKSCLDRVPRQVQCSFHPEHPLVIQLLDSISRCSLCNNLISELALTCDQCDIKFHVSCGSRTTRGLRLELHRHDMHYVILRNDDGEKCTICGAKCKGGIYRCVKCRVNVHMECIPLPEIVEHESHEYHPLKLTDSVVTHRDDDEYRCDICEEEGNIKHHSYYCNECNFIAHIECVLSHEDDTSEKKCEDEVHDSQDDWDTWSYSRSISKHFSDGQQYDISAVDDSIVNIKSKIEELALQLEAVATSDKRIENVKADMVGLVFQLEDLRKKLINCRDY